MANEFKHLSVGTELTQAEFEATGGHVADAQAAGDILYCDGSLWKRLALGPAGRILISDGAGISWAAFIPRQWKVGNYHMGVSFGDTLIGSTQVLVPNRLYATPIILPVTATYDRIAINISTAEAGTNARLGIYADNGAGEPGALVLDAGTVSLAAVAVVTIVINQQLSAGLYWVVVVANSTTAALYRATIRAWSTSGASSAFYAAAGRYVAHTYGALPDPFGTATEWLTGSPYAIPLRVASVP